MSPALLRAQAVERAVQTVEAVGGILHGVAVAGAGDDRGDLPIILLWLSKQLEDAGIVLAGGGE